MLPILVFFPACSCGKTEENVNREPSQFTVRFYTGTAETFNIPIQTVNEGELVRRPTDPTWSGHVFLGWYKERELVNLWVFTLDTVQSDMVLYARWV